MTDIEAGRTEQKPETVVRRVAPDSEVWDEWLREAEVKAKEVRYHAGPLVDMYLAGSSEPKSARLFDLPKDWDRRRFRMR